MERESNKVDNFLDQKVLEIHNKKLAEKKAKEAEKIAKKEKNKGKRKGLIIVGISLAVAAVLAITGFVVNRIFKKNNNTKIPTKPSITTVDDFGMEEELVNSEETKVEYGKTTGNIKKEDLVEKDGIIWKDKEAADKSNQVGNSSIDLQDGKLEVDKDGDVVVKAEVDYEIVDEEGNVIGSGTTSEGELPDGYVQDEDTDSIVKEEDADKFVVLKNDYYNMNGELIYQKGEKVTKETYEKIINDSNLTITKPVNTPSNNPTSETTSTESSSTTEEVVEESVINPDGTFTINGVTFIDKATYQTIVLGQYNEEDLRYNENGVIYIKENTNSKTR